MLSAPAKNQSQWHILTFIGSGNTYKSAGRVVEWFNRTENTSLSLYAPNYVVREERDGKSMIRSLSLTFHYVFVKGEADAVKKMCGQSCGFAFLIDKAGKQRYATLSDEQMRQFRIIARAYENNVPYYSLSDIQLEEGDLVEVVSGDFPGLIGRYIPNPRSKTGNVVLQLDYGLATAAYNIKAEDIRILEFARNSNRAYEQTDRFIPRLLAALRLHFTLQPIPRPMLSQLSIFANRMEYVSIPNKKAAAKLYALLASAFTVLGDQQRASKFKTLYQKNQQALTNPWTLALTNLVMAAADYDSARISRGAALIADTPAGSAPRKAIREEYDFYASHIR